jgi:hypothetical protein
VWLPASSTAFTRELTLRLGFGGLYAGDFTYPYPDLPTALGGIDDDGIIIMKSGTATSAPPSSRIMRYKNYGGVTSFGGP